MDEADVMKTHASCRPSERHAATEIKVPYDGPNSYLEVDSLLGPSR